MKLKGIKTVLFTVVALAAGYVLGAYIGWPNASLQHMSGTVGKADKFKKEVASPELKAFEEKIKNDRDFMAQTMFSLAYINSRTREFKENAEMAAEATADIEQLKEFSPKMTNLANFAGNANKAAGDALEAFNKIVEGEENVNYEEFSNNAILSYILLDKGLTLAKDYVTAADAFLQGKDLKQYSYLAFTRDQWAEYSAQDAMMNGNKEMLSYWESKKSLLDENSSKSFLASLDSQRANSIINAQELNTIVILFSQGQNAKGSSSNSLNNSASSTVNNAAKLMYNSGYLKNADKILFNNGVRLEAIKAFPLSNGACDKIGATFMSMSSVLNSIVPSLALGTSDVVGFGANNI